MKIKGIDLIYGLSCLKEYLDSLYFYHDCLEENFQLNLIVPQSTREKMILNTDVVGKSYLLQSSSKETLIKSFLLCVSSVWCYEDLQDALSKGSVFAFELLEISTLPLPAPNNVKFSGTLRTLPPRVRKTRRVQSMSWG